MDAQKEKKERQILENVVKGELDFITYVDVATREANVIITNADADVMPPLTGDYDAINAENIPLFVHPDDQERLARQMDLSRIVEELDWRGRMVVSYRLLCGGEYRRKELIAKYHAGEKGTVVFVRRDVTESYEEERSKRDRVYEALVESRHANREKSEFLERMSREIRTPLNSIIGLAYLTKECAGSEGQVRDNLQKIDLSAQYIRSLVDDIVNLSKLESGSIALSGEAVDFGRFLSDVEGEFAGLASEKGREFSFERRGGFSREYVFDEAALKRVLGIIFDNALKFTRQGGKIWMSAELVSETGEDALVRFEVIDDGIGIGEEFLPFAFEPFERERDGGARLGGGTGLGLAIARDIAGLMNGRIDATSKKGEGSTFTVTVRLDRAQGGSAPDAERPAKPDYDFSGKRALLADDSEINLEITESILRYKNFDVDTARDGEEALGRFFDSPEGYYDVILMDIRMPVMDGLEAARRIRASSREDGGSVPIIAMTANAFAEDVKKSRDAGMNEHLSKPIEILQMYSVLDAVLSGREDAEG